MAGETRHVCRMRVLLIEDDVQIGCTVAALLESESIAVETTHDGESGLARSGDPTIDVIILDRMLPGLSGTEVLARMRRAGLNKPVLVLSALGHSAQRVEGLDAGADDYLGKPFEPDELLARVRALHRRTTAQARQQMLFHNDLELDVRARTAHRAGRHLPLSPKEFELLKFLMEHAGELVTREMMLRSVWKLNFDPHTNVVDVNLVRLRRKLEQGFETSCLETVRGRGYRLVST